MKTPSLILSLILVSASAPSAMAVETMRKACTAEILKYDCQGKSESYVYDCLHKNEESSTMNNGFTHSCFKAYAYFEKITGKDEKIESHQIENREHSN